MPTPRQGRPKETVGVILQSIRNLLRKKGIAPGSLGAIGLAVPGVVGAGGEEVVFAPNLNISGANLIAPLKEKFNVPAVLGNDVNLGTLGEKWLGAARRARSVVGVFVGTGIGGGIIQDGRLLTGHKGSAGEIGHMIMQVGGPRCGCGGRGCLETLASRTAIERDLRQAMAGGRRTVLAGMVGSRPKVIKSSLLREALDRKDKLVREVMTRASEVLGHACVNIRHILDPEVIVLGGGVVEACGFFIMPIVERIVADDMLLEGVSKGKVVASQLGDDAVVLGAVALAQQAVGADPFKQASPVVKYPVISKVGPGRVTVGGRTYREDVVIRVNGKIKNRRKILAKIGGDGNRISAAELEKACKGAPSILIIAAGPGAAARLGPDAQDFLRKRNIKVVLLPARKAAEVYNRTQGRKAALIRVSG